ncbi:hypothetical protein ACFVYC_20800, partial [Pseudarthrobacter sp. NPDC058329]|uniref:hypothetical protein n=1 Tax=Pseudarthrobacter sp. NPDC058329 TaxID=3346448 RepID=UPI0036DB97DD
MEAGPERLRHQLRRKNQLNANRGSTENRTVPNRASPGTAGLGPAVFLIAGPAVFLIAGPAVLLAS